MDDLRAIVEYHDQALRSIEHNLGQLVEAQQRSQREIERVESTLRRAVRLGVAAMRREREQRRRDRAEWEERLGRDRAEWDERMTRLERNMERWLRGISGSDGHETDSSPETQS